MSLILSRAETLPDGMALKKVVFARTEELLGRKDILLKRYASSVKTQQRQAFRTGVLSRR